ncbi:MAG TPA: glycosyltransferase family 2 protein [Bacteroidota bacterium]
MLSLVELSLQGILGFFLFYLAFLSVLATLAPKKTVKHTSRQRRFAFVVPAHNEELVIERTVASLRSVDYPPDLFQIFVVADNCSDQTAQRSEMAGAIVLERTNPVERGKGYALEYAFGCVSRMNPPLDAIVVVDADSTVSRQFLRVMNACLEEGSGAIQSADVVEQTVGSWSVEATRIALLLYNVARPLGRKLIGCSAGLRGNGMCFSRDVLQTVPWKAFSLTEDLEYGLNLLLHGIPVTFAPDAFVYATMPQNSGNAESQRARWETGRFPIIRTYAMKLLAAAIRRRSFALFDAFIDLVTPAFVNMIGFILIIVVIKAIVALTTVGAAGQPLSGWIVILFAGAIHVVFGLKAAGEDKLILKSLRNFPRYVVWKIRLYTILLFRGFAKEWVRTTRESQQ